MIAQTNERAHHNNFFFRLGDARAATTRSCVHAVVRSGTIARSIMCTIIVRTADQTHTKNKPQGVAAARCTRSVQQRNPSSRTDWMGVSNGVCAIVVIRPVDGGRSQLLRSRSRSQCICGMMVRIHFANRIADQSLCWIASTDLAPNETLALDRVYAFTRCSNEMHRRICRLSSPIDDATRPETGLSGMIL